MYVRTVGTHFLLEHRAGERQEKKNHQTHLNYMHTEGKRVCERITDRARILCHGLNFWLSTFRYFHSGSI